MSAKSSLCETMWRAISIATFRISRVSWLLKVFFGFGPSPETPFSFGLGRRFRERCAPCFRRPPPTPISRAIFLPWRRGSRIALH